MPTSQQEWTYNLPIQQQSVLLLACRGADGVEKFHGSKELVRVIRSLVMNAAVFGRPLKINRYIDDNPSVGGDFMNNDCLNASIKLVNLRQGLGQGLDRRRLFNTEFIFSPLWSSAISRFMSVIDSLSYHYINHFRQACEIIAYKHPDGDVMHHFMFLYYKLVDNCHLYPESVEQMDKRLNDWDRQYWDTATTLNN